MRRRRNNRIAFAAAAAILALVAVGSVVSSIQENDSIQVAAIGPSTDLPDRPGWSWITPDKMRSRDGSATGYGRRSGETDSDLLIYLADGGACFDAASCATADDHFTSDDLDDFVRRGSVVTASGDGAPFTDWEIVVIPGSTADLHHGVDPATDVPGGPKDQDMVGARNLRTALDDLAARSGSTSPRRVVLAGSGAGAFGVILSQSMVRAMYPQADVVTIVDGAVIPATGPGLPACVLDRWQQLWDIAIPEKWDGAGDNPDAHTASNIYRRLAERFPESRFGLLATAEDAQLREWYGRDTACSSAGGPLTPEQMRRGVDEVVTLLDGLPPWSSFVVAGSESSVLASEASGVATTARPLWDWLTALVESG